MKPAFNLNCEKILGHHKIMVRTNCSPKMKKKNHKITVGTYISYHSYTEKLSNEKLAVDY